MVNLKTQAAYKLNISDLTENTYIKDDTGKLTNYLDLGGKIKVYRVRLLARVTFMYASADGNYASITLDDDTGTIRVKAWQNIKMVLDTKNEDLVDIIALVREWNGEVYLVPEVLRIIDNPDIKTLRSLEILSFKKEEGILDKDTVQKEITLIKKSLNSESNQVVSSVEDDDINQKIMIKTNVNVPKSENVKEILSTHIEKTIVSKKSPAKKTTDIPELESKKIPEKKEKSLRVCMLDIIETLDEGDGAAIDDVIDSVNGSSKDSEAVINELLSEGTCYEPRAGKIKIL
ncbi:MAG: hypothetical protein K0B07_02540 [DPANN group archaeon]|nr:hypothetical protein [DPANN group archaeon]